VCVCVCVCVFFVSRNVFGFVRKKLCNGMQHLKVEFVLLCFQVATKTTVFLDC
jgi:hypothetical protein